MGDGAVKKAKIAIILLPLAALAAGGGYYFFFLHRADQGPIKEITLYGNVDIREVKLAFFATGRIRRMHLEEGDRVSTGDLAAQMDPVRYQADAAKARAEVATRRQQLDRLLAGSRPEEIAEARAQLDRAKARLADQSKVHERYKVLRQSKSIAQQTFDNVEANYLEAKARVDQASQNLTLAVKGPRDEDIAAGRAQLAAAEAQLKLAEQHLSDTELRVPQKGVIQQRILEPGDMADPSTPVYTQALTDPVWVRAYLEEPLLGKVAPGMRVTITTDSYPGKSYQGWVGYISPTAEFTPKQVETTELRTKLVYRVRIHACNPQDELRLGMPVTVVIPLDQPKDGARPTNPCQGG